jgi:hypothetical protein
MANVTESELKDIFDTELSSGSLTRHISTAERFVERELSDQSTEVQDDVALYLSAHFASVQERREDSASFGDVSVDFEGDTGMGFSSSHYGQTAMDLDPSGTLRQIDEGRKTADVELYHRNVNGN